MIIDILGYRDWAEKLSHYLPGLDLPAGAVVHWHRESARCCVEPGTVIFLAGWSDLVPESFYAHRPVYVLHPSRLPEYRGGSPLQHQIIDGVKNSALTIFQLDERHPEVDSGPIAWQHRMALGGSIRVVLDRMVWLGAVGVAAVARELNDGTLQLREQEGLESHPPFKRRRPSESELTVEQLTTWPGRKLADLVRSLGDPYPNAYIRTADGGRLVFKDVRYIRGGGLEEEA